MKKALTLVELIVVIVIMGTIMGLGFELLRQLNWLQAENDERAQMQAQANAVAFSIAGNLRSAIAQSVRIRPGFDLVGLGGAHADASCATERCTQLSNVRANLRQAGANAIEMAIRFEPFGPRNNQIELRCSLLANSFEGTPALDNSSNRCRSWIIDKYSQYLDAGVVTGASDQPSWWPAGVSGEAGNGFYTHRMHVNSCISMKFPADLRRDVNAAAGRSGEANQLYSCNEKLLNSVFLEPSARSEEEAFSCFDPAPCDFNDSNFCSGAECAANAPAYCGGKNSWQFAATQNASKPFCKMPEQPGEKEFNPSLITRAPLSQWYGAYFRSDEADVTSAFIEHNLWPSRLFVPFDGLNDQQLLNYGGSNLPAGSRWDMFYLTAPPGQNDTPVYISSALDFVKEIRYFELINGNLVAATISYHDFITPSNYANVRTNGLVGNNVAEGARWSEQMSFITPFWFYNQTDADHVAPMPNPSPNRDVMGGVMRLNYLTAGGAQIIARNVSELEIIDANGVKMVRVCLQKPKRSGFLWGNAAADVLSACRSEVI